MRIAKGVRLAVTAVAAVLATVAARAQDYPARPIQVIVPFAGGSASDVVTRIMLDRMARTLGQPFIVDNRPGAGGNTGTQAAAPDRAGRLHAGDEYGRPARREPDAVQVARLRPREGFCADLAVCVLPNVVVINSKLPPKTLLELVAYAKQRPKELNYGSVGVGSSQHLAGAYFDQVAGVQLVHVPYRNIAQYTPDFIAGQVPLGFQFLPNVIGMLSSGDARALAVTSPKRMTALPDVPTAREAGLEYETYGWLALLGPAGMPKPVVEKLHKALEEAVNDPTVREPVHRAGRRARVAGPPRSCRSSSRPRPRSGRHHRQGRDRADVGCRRARMMIRDRVSDRRRRPGRHGGGRESRPPRRAGDGAGGERDVERRVARVDLSPADARHARRAGGGRPADRAGPDGAAVPIPFARRPDRAVRLQCDRRRNRASVPVAMRAIAADAHPVRTAARQREFRDRVLEPGARRHAERPTASRCRCSEMVRHETEPRGS